MKTLYIFDIDDTLLITNAFIHELEDGERVKSYSTEEWKHLPIDDYKGAGNYDWSNISCSNTFRETAKPIKEMVEFYKQIYYDIKAWKNSESKIIMMTGRQPMSCLETYKNTFHDLNIPIEGVEIFMAGRYMQHSPINKMVELLCYLRDNPFKNIEMYDDDPKNFREIMKLDHYSVTPYLVRGGKIEKFLDHSKGNVLEKAD